MKMVFAALLAVSAASAEAKPVLVLSDGQTVKIDARIYDKNLKLDGMYVLSMSPTAQQVQTSAGKDLSEVDLVFQDEKQNRAAQRLAGLETLQIECVISSPSLSTIERLRGDPIPAPKCMVNAIRRYAAPVKSREEQLREFNQQVSSEIAAGSQFAKNYAGRTAFVFARSMGVMSPGEPIPRQRMVSILYRDLPCTINLAGRENFRAAEYLYGAKLANACWAPLMGVTSDGVLIVDMYGGTHKDSLMSYATVSIQKDGVAQYKGQAYSFEQHAAEIKQHQDSLK